VTSGIAQGGARVGWYYAQETAGTISATVPEFKPLRLTQSSLAMSAN